MNSGNQPNLYLIDLFCGAGGVTTGFDAARHQGKQFCQVLACINHDPKAIDSHYMNHPFVKHYTEDIRQLDLTELAASVRRVRATDENAVIVLWASLECTNFSKAKGGKSRKKDSRMLADEMYRYIETLQPEYFMVENVEEFTDWGPLRIQGKEFETYCTLETEFVKDVEEYIFTPDKRFLKEYFNRWKTKIIGYGYNFEDNDEGTLNAADYGACQSRKRYFAVYAKEGFPIAWPTPTHAKNPKKFPGKKLKKWEPVRKALDLDNHGESIFHRKKPITSEKSWSRVYEGLIVHVAGGKAEFQKRQEDFLVHYRGQSKAHSIDAPSPTVNPGGGDKLYVAHCEFIHYLVNYHGKYKDDRSIDLHAVSVTTKDDCGLMTAQFLKIDHSNGQTNRSIDSPAGAVKTVAKENLVSPQFIIDPQWSTRNGSSSKSLKEASNTVMASAAPANLITPIPFVIDAHFKGGNKSIKEPIGTITANRKWHYLINPQWNAGANSRSIDRPSNTVIARLDKAPTYLITTEEGFLAIEIFETDSPMMRKVKEFMALYGIIDIKMRMLTIQELLRIQGFPKGYILVGTQGDQKKFIGNAVEVTQAKVIAQALYAALFDGWSEIKMAA